MSKEVDVKKKPRKSSAERHFGLPKWCKFEESNMNFMSHGIYRLYCTLMAFAYIGLPQPVAECVGVGAIGAIFATMAVVFAPIYFGLEILSWVTGGLVSTWPAIFTMLALYYVIIIFFDTTHLVADREGSRRLRRYFDYKNYRGWFWLHNEAWRFCDYTTSYFPFTIAFDHHTDKSGKWVENNEEKNLLIEADKQYLLGMHPHGIHCFPLTQLMIPSGEYYRQVNGNTDAYVGVGASVVFRIPMTRELFLWSNVRDAGRWTCCKALKNGNSLYIVTGGEWESLLTEQGKDRVVLKNRKGFVRLALWHGVDLIPVYGFGNGDTYTTIHKPILPFLQWLSKNFQIWLPIFYGRWFTPVPHKVPIKAVFGTPIKVPPVDKDSDAYGDVHKVPKDLIDEYHAKYIEALKELYDRHAERWYGEKRTLEIH